MRIPGISIFRKPETRERKGGENKATHSVTIGPMKSQIQSNKLSNAACFAIVSYCFSVSGSVAIQVSSRWRSLNGSVFLSGDLLRLRPPVHPFTLVSPADFRFIFACSMHVPCPVTTSVINLACENIYIKKTQQTYKLSCASAKCCSDRNGPVHHLRPTPNSPLSAGRSDKGRTWKPKVPAPVDNRAEIAAARSDRSDMIRHDPTLREFHGFLRAINCH